MANYRRWNARRSIKINNGVIIYKKALLDDETNELFLIKRIEFVMDGKSFTIESKRIISSNKSRHIGMNEDSLNRYNAIALEFIKDKDEISHIDIDYSGDYRSDIKFNYKNAIIL